MSAADLAKGISLLKILAIVLMFCCLLLLHKYTSLSKSRKLEILNKVLGLVWCLLFVFIIEIEQFLSGKLELGTMLLVVGNIVFGTLTIRLLIFYQYRSRK